MACCAPRTCHSKMIQVCFFSFHFSHNRHHWHELHPQSPNYPFTCRTLLLGRPTPLAPVGGPGPRMAHHFPGKPEAVPDPSAALDSYGDTWNSHYMRNHWAIAGIKSQRGDNPLTVTFTGKQNQENTKHIRTPCRVRPLSLFLTWLQVVLSQWR